ncbi:hypothetical protein ASG90_12615 [Nocardioides sp. Soil797]|nr:hypothetical protein ASG90_12615 [Nocardioides sp. Soil797]
MGARTRAWAIRLVAVAVISVITLLTGATAASAHAQLVSSSPGNGSVVGQPPKAITLEFNEAVTARAEETRVFDGNGAEIAVQVTTADRTVTVTPTDELSQGTVVVGYAVTSADGHPIEGSITFAVGEPTPGSSENGVFEEPTTTGIGAAHTAAVGLAVLATAALVVLLLLGRSGRWVEASWLLALGAVVLAVPLGAVEAGGVGWGALLDWEHWVDGWVSWRGLLLAVAVVAAACAVSWSRQVRSDGAPVHHESAGAGGGWRSRLPVILAVLVVAGAAPSAFAASGPSTAAAPQPGGSPVAEATSGDHTVRMTLDSTTVGTTGFRLKVLDAGGRPVQPYAVPKLRATSEGLALDLALKRESAGVWTGSVTLPSPGDWEVEVSVRLSEFENPVLTLPFEIGSRTAASSGGH